MARIRHIKPGFFTDDALCVLPPLARLLFAGLWTIADCAGRLEDRPRRIKVEILPYDNCDCDELLSMLEKSGFIVRYEACGLRVIQIVNFAKHQRLSGKEASEKSYLPEQGAKGKRRGSIGEAQEKQAPPSPNPCEGRGGEGKGSEGKGGSADAPALPREQQDLPGLGLEEVNPDDLQKLWNEICAPVGCAKWEGTTDSRLSHVNARIDERKSWTLRGTVDSWEAFFRRIAKSSFLTSQKNVGNAGWIFKPENFTKTLEGNYDNHESPRKIPSNLVTPEQNSQHVVGRIL